MAVRTKDTSTATATSTNISCSNCPRVSTPESTSQSATWKDIEALGHFYNDLEKVQKEIVSLREGQKETKDYFKRMASLAKTSQIAIIILMIVPALQLVACAAIVYCLGIQEEVSGLINWIIGGVGVLSFLEVLITAIKYFTLESKVNNLEKELERVEKN